MKCPICAHENPADAASCASCYAKFPGAETATPEGSAVAEVKREKEDRKSVPRAAVAELPPPSRRKFTEVRPEKKDLERPPEKKARSRGPEERRDLERKEDRPDKDISKSEITKSAAMAVPPPVPRSTEPSDDLGALIDELDTYLDQDYKLFGLVGYPRSGKTHCLKALDIVLQKQGFKFHGDENLRQVKIPGPTGVQTIISRVCSGPRGQRWMFIDVGGELYQKIQSNEWGSKTSKVLLHYLDRCCGIFMFLHLLPAHFGISSKVSAKPIEEETNSKHQTYDPLDELDFFDQFLIFLRTLKHKGGNLQDVLELCKTEAIGKALLNYRSEAPLLDIPIMFFLTQADIYGDNRHRFLAPRSLPVPCAPFIARFLPTLFSALLTQARHFKFDFIQSYEDVGTKDSPDPQWEYQGQTMSVGIVAGLEFMVRNLPRRYRWLGPQIETRKALRLNRRLHKKQWEDIVIDL